MEFASAAYGPLPAPAAEATRTAPVRIGAPRSIPAHWTGASLVALPLGRAHLKERAWVVRVPLRPNPARILEDAAAAAVRCAGQRPNAIRFNTAAADPCTIGREREVYGIPCAEIGSIGAQKGDRQALGGVRRLISRLLRPAPCPHPRSRTVGSSSRTRSPASRS